MKKYQIAFLSFTMWSVLGFLIGALETELERSAGSWEKDGEKIIFASEEKNGCTYKSLATFTNLGYLAACELFRKRFEINGIQEVIK